jgi:hypothetical protein
MSFLLDANYVFTLENLGLIGTLKNLKLVIIPKIIADREVNHVDALNELTATDKEKFKVIEANVEYVSDFINQMSQRIKGQDIIFVLELEDFSANIEIPDGWTFTENLFLMSDSVPKPLMNVLTNYSAQENEQIRKTEMKRILECPDVHFCAIGFRNKKYYLLSMDAAVWAAFTYLEPEKGVTRVKTIFDYLAMIFRNEPTSFIDNLIELVKNHKFAGNLYGKLATTLCIFRLESSVDQVLSRYVADKIEEGIGLGDVKETAKMFKLKDDIREVVRKHISSGSGENIFSFDEEKFINDLSGLRERIEGLA